MTLPGQMTVGEMLGEASAAAAYPRVSAGFSLVVLGRPQPAGSKRAFKHRHTGKILVVDDAKHSRPWKQQVAHEALSQLGNHAIFDGPLELDVMFVLARPKGHYRTGRNGALLRSTAPRFPTTRPDSTKLLRAVEDALTGIAWRDDSQIVTQHARKVYGVPERVEIIVRPLDPPTPGVT